MKTITMTLDSKSIDKALKEIREYKKWLQKKTDELLSALVDVGVKEASIRFTTAMYDGLEAQPDADVEGIKTNDGWVIRAKGRDVVFIEFGAGVYHNPSEPYPNPRPDGIVGIGEFGDGKGKRQGWVYKNANDERVFTRGNPSAMPLWYATQEMERQITKIAREVFGRG